MKHITFYFDVISPYAYLAFEHMPKALEGISYQVTYQPVLFAGLLKHHGQLGPAEIPSKRDWTYRQIDWLAKQYDIPVQLPATHPFNPLALLRLAVACSSEGCPNRYVVEQLFHYVWRNGLEAQDAARTQTLRQVLAPKRDPDSAVVKQQLKASTDQAIAKEIFGVPTFEVDGKFFFGLDALPMLAEYLKSSTSCSVQRWRDVMWTASEHQRQIDK